jgi:16S rRNA (guanine(966)-N(2))-methyltransferase RsmD
MRIIAGTLKGRRLQTPAWDGLRPTSDKLRETLFNVLAPRMPSCRLLDGYAGTGAVGLEAISRGAAHVTFVERDRRAVALIRRNLEVCGVTAGYTIEPGDVDDVLARLSGGPGFDVIILDPPYALADTHDVLDAAARCLNPDGVLVLERASRMEPRIPHTLSRMRDIRSGDSTLTLFERLEAR